MKIFHLANDVKRSGNGIVNVMVDLACEQSREGHEVTIISGGGEYEAMLRKHSVRHIFLQQRPMKKIAIPFAFMKFIRLIIMEKPDVIHAHMITGLFLAKLSKCFARFALVSTVHNEFNASSKYMGMADHVVGVSNAVSQSMIKRGVSEHKISTVWNGIVGTPRREEMVFTNNVTLQHPSVTTVAGLFKRKGIDVLLLAFSKSSARSVNAHLYIIGEGRDRDEFESLSVQLGLTDRVHFLGFKNNVTEYLEQTEIFVLASIKDPFPLVLLEAREAGCAIIASDIDGMPEALDGGKSGALVPPGDADCLARELTRLLDDRDYLLNARNKASIGIEQFSSTAMSNSYLNIYESMLERRKGSREIGLKTDAVIGDGSQTIQ
ncbi:glycosyltransferase family 4 protein [Paraburkholderia nemoris]|uniref:glycosyltransferase family 4 protein n=1 Tax=Paraburkholderia nemoris TaxID=2793076 RepID=UPI0038B80425